MISLILVPIVKVYQVWAKEDIPIRVLEGFRYLKQFLVAAIVIFGTEIRGVQCVLLVSLCIISAMVKF